MEVQSRRAVFIIFAGVRRVCVDETLAAPVAQARPLVPLYQTASMALHGVLVTAKLCEPTCMTEMNGICEQWYDATVGPPCRPAAALTIGMMATWLSTIVAVLVIVAKGLFGSKAKRA